MKPIISSLILATIVAFSPSPALALAGTLRHPSISLAPTFPQEVRRQIMSALHHPDCKFIHGNYLNWFTTLHFGGDTKALNGFLAELVKCPGVSLQISFNQDLPMAGDWTVQHGGRNGAFTILINLKSKQISPAALEIPIVKGPPIAQSSQAMEG